MSLNAVIHQLLFNNNAIRINYSASILRYDMFADNVVVAEGWYNTSRRM
jgi:hypothetical protein